MTRWLSHDEQVSWRSWLTATTLIPERLSRELQAQHGLTLADYEILVRLSEAEGRCLRMSDLARRTLVSRSRLTHQVDRMERAGLVSRRVCADDGRGLLACLTDEGWQRLVAAAPDHVESVRAALLDALTPEEFAALGTLSAKLVHAMGEIVEMPQP